MAGKRLGRQTPTSSVVIPYTHTKGDEAIALYELSGREAREWQKLLIYDIMARNDEDLWCHQKFGYEIPRRNGKGEIITIREMWGLENGETICHTAHRVKTSSSAFARLKNLLAKAGYVELGRKKTEEAYPEKCYRAKQQLGMETIELPGKGSVSFRTRTESGGLGEGFDLLIIDEAQEYTESQESALIYTVSDSSNPQTLYCGTPPTETSSGTVFVDMREQVLTGDSYDTGWAEWSAKEMSDPYDIDTWYDTNPSLGTGLTERVIRSEIKPGKEVDFNIQRLGLWLSYNQHSEITEEEWDQLLLKEKPKLKGPVYAAVKYGASGNNVAICVAARLTNNRIFVEALDCRPIRDGNDWIVRLLDKLKPESVIIDGKGNSETLMTDMRDAGIKKKPMLPTVGEAVTAYTYFRQAVSQEVICHKGQFGLRQAVSNCEKRAIGNNGGFGYKSLSPEIEVALVESAAFAVWNCSVHKEKKKQKVYV